MSEEIEKECEECDGKGWDYVWCGDHNTDEKKVECPTCEGYGFTLEEN